MGSNVKREILTRFRIVILILHYLEYTLTIAKILLLGNFFLSTRPEKFTAVVAGEKFVSEPVVEDVFGVF